MINKILIANRGEIAVRIINAAHQLGYQTVAVFSEADRAAKHVALADQAVLIGGAESSASYLNITAIINAAKKVQANAVHPGYGFLSENAGFASACEEAGLVFIGPSPEAINLMGNKAQAKHCMEAANVPCIPGYSGDTQQLTTLQHQAQQIGFPIYLKAALGGGGRGMRLVLSMDELPAAIDSATGEAKSAFGDGQLILEKAILNGRHIEFQVLADRQGHIIHLGERDCSLQRRHQKVIEEAPSPVVDHQLRQKMGAVAVAAAKAIGYVGAGTVEFLLTESGDFYFLEMNTRLQVEHPVTEMITGVDLVKWQLKIADGQPLTIQQQDIVIKGHAVEARLYAEDPARQFLPQTGEIKFCQFPDTEGVRCDIGVSTNQSVTAFYDPMLAKVISVGENREEARRRILRALQQTVLLGPVTNQQLLTELLKAPEFIKADTHCQFIDQYLIEKPEVYKPEACSHQNKLIALAAIAFATNTLASTVATTVTDSLTTGWRSSGLSTWYYRLQSIVNTIFNIKLEILSQPTFQVTIDEQTAIEMTVVDVEEYRWRYMVEGVIETAYVLVDQEQVYISHQSQQLNLTKVNHHITRQLQQDSNIVTVPISGRVSTVLVEPNQLVAKGDQLAVIEAMKMEHIIPAPMSGVVEKISIKKGQQVSSGGLLVKLRENTLRE